MAKVHHDDEDDDDNDHKQGEESLDLRRSKDGYYEKRWLQLQTST